MKYKNFPFEIKIPEYVLAGGSQFECDEVKSKKMMTVESESEFYYHDYKNGKPFMFVKQDLEYNKGIWFEKHLNCELNVKNTVIRIDVNAISAGSEINPKARMIDARGFVQPVGLPVALPYTPPHSSWMDLSEEHASALKKHGITYEHTGTIDPYEFAIYLKAEFTYK